MSKESEEESSLVCILDRRPLHHLLFFLWDVCVGLVEAGGVRSGSEDSHFSSLLSVSLFPLLSLTIKALGWR